MALIGSVLQEFCGIWIAAVYKMYLLQQEGKCGYNLLRRLHISAEVTKFLGKVDLEWWTADPTLT